MDSGDEGTHVDEFNDKGVYIGGFENEYGYGHAIAARPDGSLLIADEQRGVGPSGLVIAWTETGGVWSSKVFTGEAYVGSTALAVDPQTGNVLIDRGGSIELWDSSGKREQTFANEGLAESYGVALGSNGAAYATQRVADNIQSFNYVLAPEASTGSASRITETSELLNGTVSPEGEAITGCRFEYAIYGTQAGLYQGEVPCKQTSGEIGSASATVPVSAEISGLRPGSAYHFRLVASNANSTKHGADEIFIATAPPVAPLSLPDKRVYELVSTIEGLEVFPPEAGQTQSFETEEFGELIANTGGYRAAADGEAVAYVGGLSPSGIGGYGVGKNGNGNLYLSERGEGGWQTGDIEPVASERLVEGFSADLSQQIFNIGEHKFNEEHGGPTDCGEIGAVYSRSGGVGAPDYEPLATSASVDECEFLIFAGTSADDAHVLVQSPGAYTAQAVKGEEGTSEAFSLTSSEGFDNLYDRVDGHLHQVNILPDGEPESTPHATFGGRTLIAGRSFEHNFADDVSTNGSRIFWTDLNTGDLYVRENDTQPQSPIGPGGECTVSGDACTVQLDAGESQCVTEGQCKGGGGVFWAASSDGSKVFFTDCNRLTATSTAVSEGGCESEDPREEMAPTGHDLYEYDLTDGQVRDLTVDGNATDTRGADVQGVIGASEDGSYVYFVANGVLAGQNAEDGKPVLGQPNLYMSHEGKSTFVVTLEANDDQFLGTAYGQNRGSIAGDWRTEPGLRTAQVALSGGLVTFMSRRAVTGYDNHLVYFHSRKSNETLNVDLPEVFVYDASSQRIACASCAPTGAPPVQTAEEWEDTTGGHVGVGGNNTFMSRWINAEGTRVFFDSSQPLVPRDTNHRQDVYEWESNGTGGCSQAEGCVDLLSGGDTLYDAYFLDASETGGDVFFTTREQLLPGALGESVKLYDARVDGGVPEFPLACTGTGCQGVPPAPPIFATPSSVTFGGVGNFPPPAPALTAKAKSKSAKCKKGFVKKKGRCVRRRKTRRISKTKKSSAKGRK